MVTISYYIKITSLLILTSVFFHPSFCSNYSNKISDDLNNSDISFMNGDVLSIEMAYENMYTAPLLLEDNVKDIPYKPILQVYPNPCHDYVYIDMKYTNPNEDITIQIIDICGQVIFTHTYLANHEEDVKIKVVISEFKRGLFFVKAIGLNEEITTKLVIK